LTETLIVTGFWLGTWSDAHIVRRKPGQGGAGENHPDKIFLIKDGSLRFRKLLVSARIDVG
jgi:hypothetical protein